LQYSGDELFTKFKEQNYIELLHPQMKAPLAVRPVFLKSPRRVEALVTLLQIGTRLPQGPHRLGHECGVQPGRTAPGFGELGQHREDLGLRDGQEPALLDEQGTVLH
jgi:hypothetical protein